MTPVASQRIEDVKKRDQDNPFTTLYFSDLETYRAARRPAPLSLWPYVPHEELDEAMLRMAGSMPPPPTAAELARMATWVATNAPPVYTATRTAADTLVYTAGTAATSAT